MPVLTPNVLSRDQYVSFISLCTLTGFLLQLVNIL